MILLKCKVTTYSLVSCKTRIFSLMMQEACLKRGESHIPSIEGEEILACSRLVATLHVWLTKST